MEEIVPIDVIARKIYLIRGQKVMMDKDLAVIYGVKPTRLREQVRRNIRRFPEDFMFQLNEKEIELMVSQNAIPSRSYLGGYQPYVFTEQGVAMLATVLNSEIAIQANIAILRAFVKLREMISTHKELTHKLSQLERKIEKHDDEIKLIFDAIRQLMTPPPSREKKIGFRVRERIARYRTS